ncbi:hypothetical protein, partial [Cohnella sp. REN36]
INELNKHLDITLYEINETHEEVIFEIKETVALEQMQEFMQYQYSMCPQEQWDTDCFESASEMMGELSSLKELVELAEEGRFPCFQSNIITDEVKVSAWDLLRVEFSMLV